MRRREFLSFVGGAAAAFPQVARAQQHNRIARVGRLSPISVAAEQPMLEALRQGLADLGWNEGRNLKFELRFAEGRLDRLPEFAAELVRQKVDVLVTGAHSGALAAKNATTTIPIVMVTTGDPVKDGLISSLARPGGNITGVTALGQALNAKRLEILREAAPGIRRVAVLTNPASPYTGPFLPEAMAASRMLGIEVDIVEASEPSEFEMAFQKMMRNRADALMVLADVMFISNHLQIVALAAENRLPSIFGDRQSVHAGGLMFYGASLPEMYRRAAIFVDKVLKGARPADIPVEQPTKFELAINLKTAKALGLAVPPTLLARADEVID